MNIINAENEEDHDFGYTCYLPQRIEIDGLYVNGIGNYYIFNVVNANHLFDFSKVDNPVVAPQEITVKNYSCLLGSNPSVSINRAIFKTDIVFE